MAIFANTKFHKKAEKWLKPWYMDTHQSVLNESYPMNTNMTGFKWFSKFFASLCFGWKLPFNIRKVKWNRCIKTPFPDKILP